MARKPKVIEVPGDNTPEAAPAKEAPATIATPAAKAAAQLMAETYCGFPILQRNGDYILLPQGWVKERN